MALRLDRVPVSGSVTVSVPGNSLGDNSTDSGRRWAEDAAPDVGWRMSVFADIDVS